MRQALLELERTESTMADNNTLNFDLDAPAVPTLTLDPAPAAAPVEEKDRKSVV